MRMTLVAAALAAALAAGCAAEQGKGTQPLASQLAPAVPTTADVQRAALVVGELALAIDDAERKAYAAHAIDAATHERTGAYALEILRLSRDFERAVKDGGDVERAREVLLASIRAFGVYSAGVQGTQAAARSMMQALGGKP